LNQSSLKTSTKKRPVLYSASHDSQGILGPLAISGEPAAPSRLFGVNVGGRFGAELMVTASLNTARLNQRKQTSPLFSMSAHEVTGTKQKYSKT